MTITIVINEAHSLMDNQKTLLEETFPQGWETLMVSKDGWNREEQMEALASIGSSRKGTTNQRETVVFISPVPLMIKAASADAACSGGRQEDHGGLLPPAVNIHINKCLVMSNDCREKKELPGGKVISVTAQEGWYLG